MKAKPYAALAARIKNGIYDEDKLFWIAAYIKDDLKGSQIEKVNRRAMIAAYKARFHLELTPGQLAGLYARYGTPLKGQSPQASFVKAMDAYREQKGKAEKRVDKAASAAKPAPVARPKVRRKPVRKQREVEPVPPRVEPEVESEVEHEPVAPINPPPAPKPEPEPTPEPAPAPPKRTFVPPAHIPQDPAAAEALKAITPEDDATIAVALGTWHPDRVKGSPFGFASITVNGVRIGRPSVTADDLRTHIIGSAVDTPQAIAAYLKGVPAFAEADVGKAGEVAERVAAYKPPKRDGR